MVFTVIVSDSHGISWTDNWALGCDFIGNDLSNVRTKGEDCGVRCASTQGKKIRWKNNSVFSIEILCSYSCYIYMIMILSIDKCCE